MYEKAMVYDLDGDFVGWTIIKDRDKLVLQTTHLWEDDDQDVDEQLSKLNQLAALKPYWPDWKDPEVQALLNDPEWTQPTSDDAATSRAARAMHEIAIKRWSAACES